MPGVRSVRALPTRHKDVATLICRDLPETLSRWHGTCAERFAGGAMWQSSSRPS